MNRHERRKLNSILPNPVIHPECDHDFVRNDQTYFIHCIKCNDPYTLAHQWAGINWRVDR